MVDVVISPGTIGAAHFAMSVVGEEHVDPGQWPGPVYLRDLSDQDADAAIALIKEVDPTLTCTKRETR